MVESTTLRRRDGSRLWASVKCPRAPRNPWVGAAVAAALREASSRRPWCCRRGVFVDEGPADLLEQWSSCGCQNSFSRLDSFHCSAQAGCFQLIQVICACYL